MAFSRTCLTFLAVTIPFVLLIVVVQPQWIRDLYLFGFAIAFLVIYLPYTRISGWIFSSVVRIHFHNHAACEVHYRIKLLSDYEYSIDEQEVERGSFLIGSGEYTHDIRLSPNTYAISVDTGGNASCAPAWSLTNDKNLTFFVNDGAYTRASGAYFTIDRHGCFSLTKFHNDFQYKHGVLKNSTCYEASSCTGIIINGAEPNCNARSFDYIVKAIDKSIFLKAVKGEVLEVCQGKYSVVMTNSRFQKECSPESWNVTDLNGKPFFVSIEQFRVNSGVYFEVDKNKCIAATTFGIDSILVAASPQNSTCAAQKAGPSIDFFWGSSLSVLISIISIMIMMIWRCKTKAQSPAFLKDKSI
jgi:hypothetical protein